MSERAEQHHTLRANEWICDVCGEVIQWGELRRPVSGGRRRHFRCLDLGPGMEEAALSLSGGSVEHEEPELILCAEPSPIGNTNACPLEKGHDGEHYCWGEGHAHGNTYGITVMTFAGERVAHMTMEGRTQPEGVCAVLALTEVLARKLDVPHEPIRGGLLQPPCCPHCPGEHS